LVLVAIVALAVQPLAARLGLGPPPLPMLLTLGAITATYVAATGLAKRRFCWPNVDLLRRVAEAT
jgi:hypothetical protein